MTTTTTTSADPARPRLRAAFVGVDAAKLVRHRGSDRAVWEGQRWSFACFAPNALTTALWSRGVDVLVLGAAGETRSQALTHAAVAGIPRVVILADDDAEELVQRAMLQELGLEGDEAAVVPTSGSLSHDRERLLAALDDCALPPPPSPVFAGLLLRAHPARGGVVASVDGELVRGALEAPEHGHLFARGAWHAGEITRVTRMFPDGQAASAAAPPGIAPALAGDPVSMRVELPGPLPDTLATGPREVVEALVVDEPWPLTSSLPLAAELGAAIAGGSRADGARVRVFTGWTSGFGRVDGAVVVLDEPHPLPPQARFCVLPTGPAPTAG